MRRLLFLICLLLLWGPVSTGGLQTPTPAGGGSIDSAGVQINKAPSLDSTRWNVNRGWKITFDEDFFIVAVDTAAAPPYDSITVTIKGQSITGDELAEGAVTGNKIVDNAIGPEHVFTLSAPAENEMLTYDPNIGGVFDWEGIIELLPDDSITGAKLVDSTITGIKINTYAVSMLEHLSTFTSANFANRLTNESGSGVVAFSTNAILTTPTIIRPNLRLETGTGAPGDSSRIQWDPATQQLKVGNGVADPQIFSYYPGAHTDSKLSDSSITLLNATAWRLFYSNATTTAIQELVLGANGTFLQSNGAAANPTWETPAGSGDVSKVGTPVDNQIGVWTGDGTIEGDADLTFDGTDLTTTGDVSANSVTVTGTETGTMTFNGATSGSASISAPDVAGSPAEIQLPSVTGTNGQVFTTDGATPQVTSWTTIPAADTGAVNFNPLFFNGGFIRQELSAVVRATAGTAYFIIDNEHGLGTSADSIEFWLSTDGEGAGVERYAHEVPDSVALTAGTDNTSQVNYIYLRYGGGTPVLVNSLANISHSESGELIDSVIEIATVSLGAVSGSAVTIRQEQLTKSQLYKLVQRTTHPLHIDYHEGVAPIIETGGQAVQFTRGLVEFGMDLVRVPAVGNRVAHANTLPFVVPVFSDSVGFAVFDSISGIADYADGPTISTGGQGDLAWLVFWGAASDVDSLNYVSYMNVQTSDHTFNTVANAEIDYALAVPTTIPDEFHESGFLIAAVLYHAKSDSLYDLTDGSKFVNLRGLAGGTSGGGGAPPTDSAMIAAWNYTTKTDVGDSLVERPLRYSFNLANPDGLFALDAEWWWAENIPFAITIDSFRVTLNADPTTELEFSLKFADAFIGFANATIIDDTATVAGVTIVTAGMTDPTVPAGKTLYVLFDADPDDAITQAGFTIFYSVD